MSEALEMTIAVEQTEHQKKRNEPFYREAEKSSSSIPDRRRERGSTKSSEGMRSEQSQQNHRGVQDAAALGTCGPVRLTSVTNAEELDILHGNV
jgi:hypothetical protein